MIRSYYITYVYLSILTYSMCVIWLVVHKHLFKPGSVVLHEPEVPRGPRDWASLVAVVVLSCFPLCFWWYIYFSSFSIISHLQRGFLLSLQKQCDCPFNGNKLFTTLTSTYSFHKAKIFVFLLRFHTYCTFVFRSGDMPDLQHKD